MGTDAITIVADEPQSYPRADETEPAQKYNKREVSNKKFTENSIDIENVMLSHGNT